MSGPSSLPAGQTGGAPGAPNANDGGAYAPGGQLPREVQAGGKVLKEVNFPILATMEKKAGGSWSVTTLNHGGLRLPGDSCTVSDCECGHRSWPTGGGELALPSCNVMCEVCGLLRTDFRVNVANLRRHVRQKHLYAAGQGPDRANGLLYDSVKADRTQKPRKKKVKTGPAKEEPIAVDDDKGDSNNNDNDDDDLFFSSQPAPRQILPSSRNAQHSAPLSGTFSIVANTNPYAQQSGFLPPELLPPFDYRPNDRSLADSGYSHPSTWNTGGSPPATSTSGVGLHGNLNPLLGFSYGSGSAGGMAFSHGGNGRSSDRDDVTGSGDSSFSGNHGHAGQALPTRGSGGFPQGQGHGGIVQPPIVSAGRGRGQVLGGVSPNRAANNRETRGG